jgi:hypothetical protein
MKNKAVTTNIAKRVEPPDVELCEGLIVLVGEAGLWASMRVEHHKLFSRQSRAF